MHLASKPRSNSSWRRSFILNLARFLLVHIKPAMYKWRHVWMRFGDGATFGPTSFANGVLRASDYGPVMDRGSASYNAGLDGATHAVMDPAYESGQDNAENSSVSAGALLGYRVLNRFNALQQGRLRLRAVKR